MQCCVALIALFTPRLALFLVALTSDYIGTAYQNLFWPFLGFFFLPLTTLAYAFSIHSKGSVTGGYVVLVVLAVLMDLGILGGNAHAAKREKN
jgi:hypothetical protein